MAIKFSTIRKVKKAEKATKLALLLLVVITALLSNSGCMTLRFGLPKHPDHLYPLIKDF